MELTLFIIVGAVAVVAAAMMLVSENAVHSALFLILNFACIAFFFLMLNAPFLAMVQITVYAGAIMVLFLFVIMLLGAERLLPEENPRFRWLTPAAIGLALVFLVTASLAIIQGEIDVTQPETDVPQVRAVHVLDGVEAVDLYLNDDPVAQALEFGESTGFDAWDVGRYTLGLFRAGDDPQTTEPLFEQMVDLDPGELLSLTAVGTAQDAQIVVAEQDLDAVNDGSKLRLVVVNAIPDRTPIDVVDDRSGHEILIDNLGYGEASAPAEVLAGERTISAYPHGDTNVALISNSGDLEANTSTLWIFTEQRRPDNSFAKVVIELESGARASFGSPTHVGQLLFGRYVLPFEMVALVLLVAMIGAIVLTHDAVAPRRRFERRLANPPAALEQPAADPAPRSE